ncbi:hypothetical protein EON81_14760 [bacterium]|nr:MAG: hypothetical protein EON81_14760 [bacterium]
MERSDPLVMLLSLAAALLVRISPSAETSGYLVELKGKFQTVGYAATQTPKVTFPLPRNYRGQVPLSFEMKVKPENALVSGRVVEGKCGDRVVELSLKPMKEGKKVDMEWSTIVFADASEREAMKLPEAVPFPDRYPREVQPWLISSIYVEATDSRIVTAAAPFKRNDVVATIKGTLAGSQEILRRQSGMATDLSSLQALDKAGSCTSNANLLAALLRANNVPARILAGYPTWSERPLQTHYIVEAYVPTYGWYPLESTLGTAGWPCSEMPIVSIVPVEYENKGIRRPGIAPGVPYLTLNEASEGVVNIGTLTGTYSDHVAKTLGMAKLPEGGFVQKQARWEAWLTEVAQGWKDLSCDVQLPRKE